MNFMDVLENSLSNSSYTENGARGYASTGHALLDMNFKVPSYRSANEEKIFDDFCEAFRENQVLALRWLFYARDIRGGLGERSLFRIIMSQLAADKPTLVKALIPLIPEYGRWDDVVALVDCPEVRDSVIELIREQSHHDLFEFGEENGKISLLAKWLPSVNASSRETRRRAKIIYRGLGLTESSYRKYLSTLRKRLRVVERDMSANRWDKIDYSAVPSKASLIYKDAFSRHDSERYEDFLKRVESGEAKINAGTLFPHEIARQYNFNKLVFESINPTLEALWKNLPNVVPPEAATLVVSDTSGSMEGRPLEISLALSVYFAERLRGVFKNKFITFSSRPNFIDLSGEDTLLSKLAQAYYFSDCSNTNIERVFELILNLARENHLSQADMPRNILIVSDMEFDANTFHAGERLFDSITKRFEQAGYTLPRIVFWNVASRTNTIPLRGGPNGVVLVSGYSPNAMKMVMSGELDPYKCLVKTLMTLRYDAVAEALRKI